MEVHVLILDGNSQTHVLSNLRYLICLRHLFKFGAVTNIISILKEKVYFPSYVWNMVRVREAAKKVFFLLARPLA